MSNLSAWPAFGRGWARRVASLVSGSSGVVEGEDIEIANNVFLDDTGDADRTEWGVYCLVGSNIRVHHNHFSGFATGNVYFDATYVSSAALGAAAAKGWIVKL